MSAVESSKCNIPYPSKLKMLRQVDFVFLMVIVFSNRKFFIKVSHINNC